MASVAETGAESEGGELKRSISLTELTALGVGATVGTGIFFVLEDVVPTAGPAHVISFLLAGVTAGLTALCYAELASTIPVSGLAYSYAYAVLGEIVAYFIGWCLLLRGSRESALVNLIMVCIKVEVLILFIVIALSAFDSGNLTPFAPDGMSGITAAAGTIFFTFIGIDAVSTAGEEVHNPKRTLPLAIIAALTIVTTLYVLTAFTATGGQAVDQFTGEDGPELAEIMKNVTNQTWPATILEAGAVISIFSVTLVVLYGQTRILFSMARDGLMPSVLHEVDTRTGVPRKNTLIVAGFVGLLAAFVPLDWIWDMVSIGTLAAFSVVSLGVIILRRT